MRTRDEKPVRVLAAEAAATAGLLDTGRTLSVISGAALLMLLAAVVCERSVEAVALVPALALGLAQAVFAWRVHFDAGIFRGWSRRWLDDTDPTADMAAFDLVLGRRVAAPEGLTAAQDLAGRRGGALRLMWAQAFCVLAQTMVTAFAVSG